ncbi:MAG: CsbD family protein [Chthoniobacterales bacterium]
MKSSTKDKVRGKVDQATGAVKEKGGRATGNPDMRDRGTGQKIGGKVREKVGDVKKVFGK